MLKGAYLIYNGISFVSQSLLCFFFGGGLWVVSAVTFYFFSFRQGQTRKALLLFLHQSHSLLFLSFICVSNNLLLYSWKSVNLFQVVSSINIIVWKNVFHICDYGRFVIISPLSVSHFQQYGNAKKYTSQTERYIVNDSFSIFLLPLKSWFFWVQRFCQFKGSFKSLT